MSIKLIEGGEHISSLADIEAYSYFTRFQVPTIISSDSDVTARNGQKCFKMSSFVTTGSIPEQTRLDYPKLAVTTESNTSHGIVNFWWYNIKPATGNFDPTTPIAAVCDPDGKVHFFICVNNAGNVEIRRWNTSATMSTNNTLAASDYAWNSDHTTFSQQIDTGFSYCDGPTVTIHNHHIVVNTSDNNDQCPAYQASSYNAIVDTTNKLQLIGTADQGNLLAPDDWNHIEVEFSLSSTTTGFVKVKLNRSSSDSSLDGDFTSVQTTSQSNNNARVYAFGTFWGHINNGLNSYTDSEWNTYIDDVVVIDCSDSVAPTGFIGPTQCNRIPYDTSNSITGDGALTDVDEPFNGPAGLSDKILLDTTDEEIKVSATGIVASSDIIAVQPVVYGYNTVDSSTLEFSTTINSTTTSATAKTLSNDPVNGGLTLGPVYTQTPEGDDLTQTNARQIIFNHIVK